ncbi:MAG TPA: DUF3617 domain-containing protein [Rhizomicrobium sp.]
MRKIVSALAAVLIAAGAAWAATPHGKPGLWTITTTMHMANMPQIPPEALAAMKARGMKMPGMGEPTTTQMCMTQEEVNTDPAARMQAQHEVNCTPHVVNQTATSATTDIVCHGTMEGTGRSEISWRGDGHYEGNYEFKGTMHGQPNQISTHYTGDFVKTDCGAVKPFRSLPSPH